MLTGLPLKDVELKDAELSLSERIYWLVSWNPLYFVTQFFSFCKGFVLMLSHMFNAAITVKLLLSTSTEAVLIVLMTFVLFAAGKYAKVTFKELKRK